MSRLRIQVEHGLDRTCPGDALVTLSWGDANASVTCFLLTEKERRRLRKALK